MVMVLFLEFLSTIGGDKSWNVSCYRSRVVPILLWKMIIEYGFTDRVSKW